MPVQIGAIELDRRDRTDELISNIPATRSRNAAHKRTEVHSNLVDGTHGMVRTRIA